MLPLISRGELIYLRSHGPTSNVLVIPSHTTFTILARGSVFILENRSFSHGRVISM